MTPIPEHATLPGKLVIPSTKSTNSKISMTPPPSSQVSQPVRTRSRTATPAVSHLSSPPPTVAAPAQSQRSANYGDATFTTDRIQKASPEELRSWVTDLVGALQDAKTVSAHHKLQHQMLLMESAEAAERMAVEMDMAQREVEVLQTVEQQRHVAEHQPTPQPDADPNFRSVHVDLYSAMVQEMRELKSQNAYLDGTTAHQKRLILQQENEIASLNDRVVLMRDRIRESRDHLTKYRRGGGMLDSTPRTNRSTPYQTPRRDRSAPNSQEQQGFAALLHATDLVSQGTMSATPKLRHRKGPVVGHSGAGYSSSSLPATPHRLPAKTLSSAYYTPHDARQSQIKVPQTEPVARRLNFHSTPVSAAPLRREEREHDSDGTVSASDDSEAETEVPDRELNVGDSQASQLASQMLRSPTGKRHRETAAPRGMLQSKLFGQVQKAGIQREESREAKRARVNSIGLGIADAGVKE